MSEQPVPRTIDGSAEWLVVAGVSAPELAAELERRVRGRRQAGTFTLDNQRYVEKVSLTAVKGSFATSPSRAEMLRKLCQIYGVDMKAREVSSHRKVIGPVIVATKRFLFRLVKPLVGPAFEQQRNFNAAVIYLLTDLCNEYSSIEREHGSDPAHR